MKTIAILDQVKKILDNHLELKGLRKTPERYAIINEIFFLHNVCTNFHLKVIVKL